MADQDHKVLVELNATRAESLLPETVAGAQEKSEAGAELRNAIRTALASNQHQVEEEYRVVGERNGRLITLVPAQLHLESAREDMGDYLAPDSPYSNVRIQSRKVVTAKRRDLDKEDTR